MYDFLFDIIFSGKIESEWVLADNFLAAPRPLRLTYTVIIETTPRAVHVYPKVFAMPYLERKSSD